MFIADEELPDIQGPRLLQCPKLFLVGSQGRKTYNPEEFDEDIRHQRQESTASAIQSEDRVISESI